jgi:hypothetical protein
MSFDKPAWSAIANPSDLIATNSNELSWFSIAENRAVNRASYVLDRNTQVIDIYDYDRDGNPDLLWRDRQSYYFLTKGQRVDLFTISDPNWQIERVGDFDGDHDRDILWRNQRSGEVAFWYLNGMSLESGQITTTISDLAWQIADVQDYDKDGDLDLFWHNDRTCENAFWQMNGTTLERGIYIDPIAGRTLEGSGDFDGDGRFDLLWRNVQSGQVEIWQLNGMSVGKKSQLSIVPDFSWDIKGLSDYNQDGTTDILWQQSPTGIAGYWSINQLQFQTVKLLDFGNFRIQSLEQSYAPSSSYSTSSGYGLVNAASAIASALKQAAFTSESSNAWSLDMLNVPEVWTRGYTGQGITIAVIDSGVDINHSDLKSNIWTNSGEIPNNGIDDDRNGFIDDVNGWNFSLNNNDISPSSAHGTAVSGVIAAAQNNAGITGVAYNAKLMPLRVSDAQDNWNGNLAKAIRYAVDNGVRVINLSLWWTDSAELREALAYAASRNVITVTAALNEGASQPSNPASYATQFGIAVGAVDRDRHLASFSNRSGANPKMNYVLAPGQDIETTVPGNSYQSGWWGTSLAAPYVSGVVALMLSANPTLTHDQVRQILMESGNAIA